MRSNELDAAENFYEEVISYLGKKYPAFFASNVKIFKVLPAFRDKLALANVLKRRNMIMGFTIKRSSLKMQPDVARKLVTSLKDDIVFYAPCNSFSSTSSLAHSFRHVGGHPFIVSDHGGYFSRHLSHLAEKQGFLGVTEHTVNGERRTEKAMKRPSSVVPFMSYARLGLKQESDQKIAQSIVASAVKQSWGKNVLIFGYGSMGQFAAQELIKRDYDVAIIEPNEERAKRVAINGFPVTDNLEGSLQAADLIILATDRVNGQESVLSEAAYKLIREGTALTSMTSIDDEIDIRDFRRFGAHIRLLNNGISLNSCDPYGGADSSIHLVEAAGLAYAFMMAEEPILGNVSPPDLLPRDQKAISDIGHRHFQ